MKTLILYAHPDTEPRGNCYHILLGVRSALASAGEEYALIDLYKDGFNPVMAKEEHYVSGGKSIAEEVLAYQKQIAAAKRLIIIHPVWWGGMPAILKGFFDRVLTPGFGYQYVNGMPKKLFRRKCAVVFLTTGGPWWHSRFVQESRAIRNIANDILGFLGVKTKVFLFSDARMVIEERKKEIRVLAKKGVSHLLKMV
jgi:NAD(P)H dehydrogenase (quinone)